MQCFVLISLLALTSVNVRGRPTLMQIKSGFRARRQAENDELANYTTPSHTEEQVNAATTPSSPFISSTPLEQELFPTTTEPEDCGSQLQSSINGLSTPSPCTETDTENTVLTTENDLYTERNESTTTTAYTIEDSSSVVTAPSFTTAEESLRRSGNEDTSAREKKIDDNERRKGETWTVSVTNSAHLLGTESTLPSQINEDEIFANMPYSDDPIFNMLPDLYEDDEAGRSIGGKDKDQSKKKLKIIKADNQTIGEEDYENYLSELYPDPVRSDPQFRLLPEPQQHEYFNVAEILQRPTSNDTLSEILKLSAINTYINSNILSQQSVLTNIVAYLKDIYSSIEKIVKILGPISNNA